jgi:glutaredoxin
MGVRGAKPTVKDDDTIPVMITVYGADWCEDTRRSLRHLRRLGVPHRYENVDEDLDALHRAISLNGGVRRTPTIDLGLGAGPLVEPNNDTLTSAIVEVEMLSQDQAVERLGVQNVGDVERIGRTIAGLAIVATGSSAPRSVRWPMRLLGAGIALTGLSGWCPVYSCARVTSLGGPGDRPDESTHAAWLSPLPPEITKTTVLGAPQASRAGAQRGDGVPASDGDGGPGGAKPPGVEKES